MTDNKRNKLSDKIVSSVDGIMRDAGYGGRSTAYRESVRGIDINGGGQPVLLPRVKRGLCFFTRPLLNLTYNNLSRERTLIPWREAPEYSVARMNRVYLDPLNQTDTPSNIVKDKSNRYFDSENVRLAKIDSPLVDKKSAFINILTNRLISLSGWPDTRVDHYASDKGIRNEQWIMSDGQSEINDAYTLEANFKNAEGDDVYDMFNLWVNYMYRVRVGDLYPYPRMIALREMDYFTRVYSFNFDITGTYITHFACCGAMFPTNYASGVPHNYDKETIYNQNLEQVTVSFQAVGARYNDPIILQEFNKVVAMFNADLALVDMDGGPPVMTEDGSSNIPAANKGDNNNAVYIKLNQDEKKAANYHAYPLINLVTKELEWWCHRNDYIKYVLGGVDDITPRRQEHSNEKLRHRYRYGTEGNNDDDAGQKAVPESRYTNTSRSEER